MLNYMYHFQTIEHKKSTISYRMVPMKIDLATSVIVMHLPHLTSKINSYYYYTDKIIALFIIFMHKIGAY